MAFEPIKRVLPKAIESAGIKSQVDAVRVITLAEELLRRLWGDDKAVLIRFVSWSQGILKVESASAAAVQEFKLMEARFVNELNRQLDGKIVRALNVRHA